MPDTVSNLFPADTSDPHTLAQHAVQRTVHEMLRAEHGQGAITERPISPRFRTPLPSPTDWGQGVAAARQVAGHARTLMVEYARKARGDGATWAELAGPLDVPSDEWTNGEEAAFELVAGNPYQRFDPRTAYWTCTTCEQHITDYGPYNRHPVDCESGHAEDCARHRRESGAYEQWIEDND